MNGKPDEHLDQWVRQSLGELPDTLPPNSSFNAERLWGQMSPRLTTKATPKLPKLAWWAAAACLMGIVWSVWRNQNVSAPSLTNQQHQSEMERIGPTRVFNPEHRPLVGITSPRTGPVPVNHRGMARQVSVPRQTASLRDVAPPPIESVAPVDQESAPLTESVAMSVLPPTTGAAPATPLLVPTAPKRRFRVVHINELAAGAEARPAPDRAERFVRLGTRPGLPPTSDDSSPSLVLSLATKSTQ